MSYIFKPMLALSTNSERGNKKLHHILNVENKDYWAEPKIDGHRAVYYNGGIFSRSAGVKGTQREYTTMVDHISKELHKEDPDRQMILDGELAFDMVCKAEDVTSILGSKDEEAFLRAKALVFFIFDIIRLPTGEDVSKWTMVERRKALDAIFTLAHTRFVIPTEIYDPKKGYILTEVQELAKESGWEGLMFKNKHSLYFPGERKANTWYKWKIDQVVDEQVFILNILEPEKYYRNKTGKIDVNRYTRLYSQGLAGSVEVGQYDQDGKMIVVAKVGGWTDQQRKDFSDNPEKWIGKVFDVTAFRRTKVGKLISPRFVQWREDLNAEDCTFDYNYI